MKCSSSSPISREQKQPQPACAANSREPAKSHARDGPGRGQRWHGSRKTSWTGCRGHGPAGAAEADDSRPADRLFAQPWPAPALPAEPGASAPHGLLLRLSTLHGMCMVTPAIQSFSACGLWSQKGWSSLFHSLLNVSNSSSSLQELMMQRHSYSRFTEEKW